MKLPIGCDHPRALVAVVALALSACNGSVTPGAAADGSKLAFSGAITDYTGLCVDVQWNDTANGTPVQLWDCNGTAAQQWTLDNGQLVGTGGKCLDVQWGNIANGTPVQLWDCNGTAAQQWTPDQGRLVGIGGKCLDVSDFHSVDGQVLQIWDCNGGANQQFMLGSSSTTPPPPAPPPPPPPPPTVPPASDDLAAAKAFLAPLGLGFNVERGWAWSVPGGAKAEAQYLASLGVTHVRLFFPWSPTVNYGGLGFGVPSQQQMRTFFDAVQQWIDGGVTVFVDCADELDTDDFANHKDAVYAEVQAMATVAASYNFPKDKFAIGPVNEWVGDDGSGGDPYAQPRQDLHDILRQTLPGYVLTVSSDYWDYYRNLEAMQPVSDRRVIYSFHAYENHSATDWTSSVVAGLTQWSHDHGGLPILMGEAGPYNTDTPGWADWLGTLEPSMAVFRPTLWAITYGSALRWNKPGDDASLQDGSNGSIDLKSAVVNAAAAAKAALAGNDGAP